MRHNRIKKNKAVVIGNKRYDVKANIRLGYTGLEPAKEFCYIENTIRKENNCFFWKQKFKNEHQEDDTISFFRIQ